MNSGSILYLYVHRKSRDWYLLLGNLISIIPIPIAAKFSHSIQNSTIILHNGTRKKNDETLYLGFFNSNKPHIKKVTDITQNMGNFRTLSWVISVTSDMNSFKYVNSSWPGLTKPDENCYGHCIGKSQFKIFLWNNVCQRLIFIALPWFSQTSSS